MKRCILVCGILVCIFMMQVGQVYGQRLQDYAGSCTGKLKVVKMNWQKGGFESVGIINSITIKNESASACKDLMCFADFYAASGTRIGAVHFFIYEIIPAGKTKTFRNINIGFLPSPADQIRKASVDVLSGVEIK